MKAVLVSFFDSNNIGDLLISDALYKRVNKHFDEVTSVNFLDGRIMEQGEKITIEPFTPQAAVKVKSKKTEIAERLADFKLTSLNYLYLSKIKDYKLNDFEEEIKAADALIIGGGNMIFDIYERTLVAARFDNYVELAKKHNKKVFAMSLGIGPFQTEYQEKMAVNALAKCDYVTFRDEKSYAIYNKSYPDASQNVSVAVDPVFSMPKIIQNPSGNQTVGINIINNPEYSEDKAIYEKVINGYVLLINELSTRQNKQVKLFSTETRDYEVIHAVYERLEETNNVSVVDIHNVDELMDLYSNLSLLVAARMHSMIIAYTQHLPVVGLTWQPKVQAMFDIIGEPEDCFNLTEIPESFDSIIKASLSKLNTDNTVKMEKQLKIIREKEQKNEEILTMLAQE